MNYEDEEVYTSHCCALHGCKYGHPMCIVTLKLVKQLQPCNDCPTENDVRQSFEAYQQILKDRAFVLNLYST